MMTSIERIKTVINGLEPDRTPVIGGWIACIEHICTLAECTLEEYIADPLKKTISAYGNIGTDGLIDLFIPKSIDDYRFLDSHTYMKADRGISLEECIETIDSMPSPEKIEADFDLEGEYAKFKQGLLETQALCKDMLFMPAQWFAGAKISWFFDFGYENFFLLAGIYEDKVRKLLEVGGAQGRNRSKVVARAVAEGIYPEAIFLGEDICSQRGPMVSPDFLEKYYAPQLKYGLEPLLEAGCKPIWHCDGDVRLLLDMFIDCGVQGFQGFQPECGMILEDVVQKRTREGKPLIILGPLAVTTELPVCTPDEIKMKVRHAIDVCKKNANLLLFTSNTINPDVPLKNILAMYEAVKEEI